VLFFWEKECVGGRSQRLFLLTNQTTLTSLLCLQKQCDGRAKMEKGMV
jgi:hypothetical protein